MEVQFRSKIWKKEKKSNITDKSVGNEISNETLQIAIPYSVVKVSKIVLNKTSISS
jgi:hypothetical protein